MSGHAFALAGAALVARASGALWWPAARLLAVGDLHLGRSARMARRGGALLPPYETTATLARLAAEVAALAPERVVCLGDSFDDDAAAGEMAPAGRAALSALIAGRDWIWVAGNHDPAPPPGGTACAEWVQGPLVFRHIPGAGAGAGEISAHLHPKARVAGRTRPCFVIGRGRAVLPAFGCYTGGLSCADPAVAALAGPGAIAVLTGAAALPVPLPLRR